MSIDRIREGSRYSKIVVFAPSADDRLIFLSGQVADDPLADVATQTRQVLAAIGGSLALAGSGKSGLLSATVYLKDMADFPIFNEIWEDWIVPGAKPTRTTVQATMTNPNWKVEIQVIAAAPAVAA